MNKTQKTIAHIASIIGVLSLLCITMCNTGHIKSKSDVVPIINVGHIDSIPADAFEDGVKIETIILPVPNWKDSAIIELMKSEGFREKPYKGLGGNMLIGYGCTYPRLWNKPHINRIQARFLLEDKFEDYIAIAEADGLEGHQAYSIADFIYNVGRTRYKNSTLRKLILADKPIDKEIGRAHV